MYACMKNLAPHRQLASFTSQRAPFELYWSRDVSLSLKIIMFILVFDLLNFNAFSNSFGRFIEGRYINFDK